MSQNTIHVEYADDSSLVSTFERIKEFFKDIIQIGPSIGYHPEPSKILTVTYIGDTELSTAFFAEEV